jgi:hypothetical protein
MVSDPSTADRVSPGPRRERADCVPAIGSAAMRAVLATASECKYKI